MSGARIGPLRTALFAPAGDARKLQRAWASGADAVILDLEDAIAATAKDAARAALAEDLRARPAGAPPALVRINAPASDAGRRDLVALEGLPVDALVVPKAEADAVAAVADRGVPVVALVETAAGVLDAARIARTPGVALLMLGPVDLSAELGCDPADELLVARSQLVLASAAARLPQPLDGPCLALDDADALHAESLRARRLGFGGKACIHPRQLDVVAAAFADDEAQRAWAARVVAAHAEAERDGGGVTVVDGQMVDAPVVRRARAVLAREEALA